MKPEIYQSDPMGMGETRVQAATLLCKIFLHYLVLLSEWDGMLDLWLKILEIMDRLMNSGQGDSLVSLTSQNNRGVAKLRQATGGSCPRKSKEHPPRHGRRGLPRTTSRKRKAFRDLGRDLEAR
jgi:brefeldin A-resistance guanine nucleotide exchange factor 1